MSSRCVLLNASTLHSIFIRSVCVCSFRIHNSHYEWTEEAWRAITMVENASLVRNSLEKLLDFYGAAVFGFCCILWGFVLDLRNITFNEIATKCISIASNIASMPVYLCGWQLHHHFKCTLTIPSNWSTEHMSAMYNCCCNASAWVMTSLSMVWRFVCQLTI